MNILVPMAGPDDAFKEKGFHYCKSLIEIDGKPVIQRVHENLATIENARQIFVIRKDEDDRFHLGEVLRLLNPANVIIRAESMTAGAACTALAEMTTETAAAVPVIPRRERSVRSLSRARVTRFCAASSVTPNARPTDRRSWFS